MKTIAHLCWKKLGAVPAPAVAVSLCLLLGGINPVADDSESILQLPGCGDPILPLLGTAGNYFKKKTGAGSARFCLWGGCCSEGWVPPLVFTTSCQALLCPGALRRVWAETLNAAIPRQRSWL